MLLMVPTRQCSPSTHQWVILWGHTTAQWRMSGERLQRQWLYQVRLKFVWRLFYIGSHTIEIFVGWCLYWNGARQILFIHDLEITLLFPVPLRLSINLKMFNYCNVFTKSKLFTFATKFVFCNVTNDEIGLITWCALNYLLNGCCVHIFCK